MSRTPNRLQHETSPYLRQHALNPVDWYPWGDEAIAQARTLDRPIFLSIGYSACHWCHVMEHESFEDEATAKLLNEKFICIKVDREERPDLDQIYMSAVQLMTGQGGWPMSMFLTPKLHPFYGGTYFPPTENYGRPSFRRVLTALADAWRTQRAKIEEQAEHLTHGISDHMQIEPEPGPLHLDLLRKAGAQLKRAFDPIHGGFGQAPKFLHSMDLRLLLRLWQRDQDPQALEIVCKTLDRMAQGGIYDHLGGGFARYSTDARWLVPHFEKMLYDNALLAVVYLEAFQATKNGFYRRIVEETLDFVLREMTSPSGAFYSTLDADSEGVEGKFYVWKQAEIEQILGSEAKLLCEVYNVREAGNWEGHNILHRTRSDEEEAAVHSLPIAELQAKLQASRAKLYAVRSQRIWPGRDEKILTSWNALMITAFARAAQVLDRPDYAEAATRAGDFLRMTMTTSAGRLYRTTFAGAEPKLNGYLEDYAFFLEASLALYETNFDPIWLEQANHLAQIMIDHFWDAQEHGFFYTSDDHETLIARSKDPHDNATPSGNGVAVTSLLRLAEITGSQTHRAIAEQTLLLFRGLMQNLPPAVGQMLLGLDYDLGPTRVVVVVGARDHADVQAVLRLARTPYQPRQIVAWTPSASEASPLFAGRTAQGSVTTYVCENIVCQAPVIGVPAAEKILESS